MASFVNTMEPEARTQYVSVLSDGLKGVWMIAVSFSAFGCLVFPGKEYKLCNELNTEFGIVNEKQTSNPGTTLSIHEENEDRIPFQCLLSRMTCSWSALLCAEQEAVAQQEIVAPRTFIRNMTLYKSYKILMSMNVQRTGMFRLRYDLHSGSVRL